MKILILGGTGMLGPWVIKALKNKHEILNRITYRRLEGTGLCR